MLLVSEDVDSLKWYEHEEEMVELSKRFPTTLFTLHGEGEDNADVWDKYFLNGKIQRDQGRIVYEGFNPVKLREYNPADDR